MSVVALTELKFSLNEDEFYGHLRMKKGSRRAIPIQRILEAAKEIPNPKVLYRVSEAKIIDANSFTLDGILFKSALVVDKIRKGGLIFPNIVTSGVEIENYCMTMNGMLEQYITMELCNSACRFAQDAMAEDVKRRYGTELVDCLYPGEEGFHLDYGKNLFDLFDDVEKTIGVTISETGLPTPSRTAYSICFGKK
ncbi:hypothetical protein [Acetobacterium bakii]|uniref:AdoMet activation domain-containing protein n=1 Tax=Acetobacterium bakii TaxID=52689 RepID=A0A0L6U1H8_9FIRM|nr:hypothetical protein [Acetobacterium bakii]KNZ42353.1 hypothetical protein AKG39_06880 [Acetobacterium bakii]